MPPIFRYFPFTGRGAATRIALGASGIEYKDETLYFPDFMAIRKSQSPEDQLPMLSLPTLTLDDGTIMTQSNAILRWAGKKADLYPQDPDLAIKVDECLDMCEEYMAKKPFDKDPVKDLELKGEFAEKYGKRSLRLLEKRCIGPYYLGEKMSIADLAILQLTVNIEGVWGQDPIWKGLISEPSLSVVHPKLAHLHNTLAEHPLVKEHGHGLKLFKPP